MNERRVVIFASGCQRMDWEDLNCCRCTKMGYTPEGWCTCGIQGAISAAAVDDGTVSARIAERMGYTDSQTYSWKCRELELREEVKIANKEGEKI